MRTTTAFFAGAGTIAVALAAGLGGGLLISNIVSSQAGRGTEQGGTARDGSHSGIKRRIRIFALY